MSISDIFSKPHYIKGIGEIYPVQLKDWEEFNICLNFLMLSEKHFETNENVPLFDMLIFGLKDIPIIDILLNAFKIVLRNENIDYTTMEYFHGFIIDENYTITHQNYNELREVILRQNLVFEPKVYKDKLMQEWANKVLEARNKNALNVTLEDMISTVAMVSGKHYWDLEKYTIYQIQQEFQRIMKYADYNSRMIMFANPYMDHSKISTEHFVENIDMYKSPYDDLFKSKDKLSNINKAIQN